MCGFFLAISVVVIEVLPCKLYNMQKIPTCSSLYKEQSNSQDDSKIPPPPTAK